MASGWHDEDRAFLASIIGPEAAAPGGEAWAVLRRGGRVLLTCRREREALAKALALYQPQRPAAKLVRAALATGAPWGAVSWLPALRFVPQPDHPLDHLERTHGLRIRAILLGNPTQAERRAVLFAEGNAAGPQVFKLGTRPLAVEVVRRESAFLAEWGGRVPAIPRRETEASGPGWHAFALAFLDGQAVDDADLETVTGVLQGWLMTGKPRPAADFRAWQKIDAETCFAQKATAFRELGQRLELRPSLVHHDLAPWNLIRTTDGRVMAIDWESGEADGVPGWDLVHFFHQTASLVKRLPPPARVESILRSLELAPARRFLQAAGWQGESTWLLASYLAGRVAAGDASVNETLRLAVAAA